MDDLDMFNNEDLSEEDLWNLHHAAALGLAGPSGMGAHKEEEDLSGDPMSGMHGDGMPRPRHLTEYSCDVCGETFYSIVQLAKHRQFHDADRPYQCRICGKRFLSRSHHHEHQRVHTGERPFPCERCDRSFTTHHNLKRHMTIHEKEEMYRCQQCGVLFCQEHEYKLENMRLPETASPPLPVLPIDPTLIAPPKPRLMLPAVVAVPPAPQPLSYPSAFSMEYQIPELPSHSGADEVKMSSVFVEKKRYKRKKDKVSLFEVSKNIAGHSPAKKLEVVLDADIPEYRRKGANNMVQKIQHGMQRIAYDIEVVL